MPFIDPEQYFFKNMFTAIWYNFTHGDIKNTALDGFLVGLILLWEVAKIGFIFAIASFPIWIGALIK